MKRFIYQVILVFVASLFQYVMSFGDGTKQLTTCFDGLRPTPQGMCLEHINESPTSVCAETSDMLKENKCRLKIPMLKQCSEGYTKTPSGDCTSFVIEDATYFCPQGYVDDDNVCIQRLPGLVKATCSQGNLEGNSCVLTHIVPMDQKISCPEKSTPRDDICWKSVETFDCTGQYDCEKKCALDNSCRNHNGRNNSGRRGLSDISGLVPVSAPRSTRVTIIKQLCQKEVQVPAIVTRLCPADYIQISEDKCSRKTITSPQYTCVETNGPPNSCPDVIKTTEKKSKCTEGSIPLPHGKCKRISTVPGVPYCPPDFVAIDTMCVTLVKAPLKCPPDLKLENGRCIGTRFYPPVKVDTQTFQIIPEEGSSAASAKLGIRSTNKKSRFRE
jgi:hypothetical protein